MQTLISLLFSIIVLLAGAGCGRALRKPWRSKDEELSDSVLLDAVLGLGALSLVIFVLGVCRLFSPRWIPPAVVLAAAAMLAPRFVKDLIVYLHKVLRQKHSIGGIVVGMLLATLALAALVPALAPPSMSDWDSLAYHLAVPRLYLEHGGIYYIDFTSHSNFPFLMEMLYIPALAMGDPVAGKLMHFWTGVLLIASVAALTAKHFNGRAAILAAIGLAGMPIALWEATTGYIDLSTALFTVAAVKLFLDYLDKPALARLVGCGIAAGFAASTKMTGLAVIGLIAVWLIMDRFLSPSPQPSPARGEGAIMAHTRGEGAKAALLFAGIALLVCAPWYVKSAVYTGNPVYPFFYSIFGGKDWTEELAHSYSALQTRFGMGHDLVSFLRLPYDLTVHSELFYDTPGLFVGPILLVSVPIMLLTVRYRSRKLVGLLGFFLAQMVIWFALTQQSRYLIPAFAVLTVLAAAVVYQDERLRLARTALWTVFVVTAVFGIWTLYPAFRNAAPVVFGAESRGDYLARALDIYPAEEYMNEYLPRDAKVALYGDTRGFYLDRAYVWADPGHNAAFTHKFNSSEDLIKFLKSKGITHAMINFRFFPKRGGKGVGAIYQAIDKGEFEQVYDGRAGVFEIK